jgi:hypothetical protein
MFRSVVVTIGAVLALVSGPMSTASPASAVVPEDGYPPGTTLQPAQLDRGADTPLLHIAEEVIVDGATTIPVDGPAHVWLLGRIGADYLVETAGAGFMHYTVQLVQPDGQRQVLQRFGQRVMPTVSSDGRRLALVSVGGSDTRIRVVKTRTGELVRERVFASAGAEVSDYGFRRMVVVGVGGRAYWWNPEVDRLSLLVKATGAWADIAADRLVVLEPHPRDDTRDCQRTVALSTPSVVLWRSCRDIPGAFSPNGRMVTFDIRTDGIGPAVLQVRGSHGKVLHTYRVALFFGFIEWESNGQVLLQPVGKRWVAAVRCDLGGGCERASDLYVSPGTFDPPETMRWSFPD